MRSRCIYCLEYKPASSFKKVEHVIPRSFGTFQNNFTLKKRVCDECNQYFGNNLEIVLARDTIEGSFRPEFGAIRIEAFKNFGKGSKSPVTIADGKYRGAYVCLEYSSELKCKVFKKLPQIGFRYIGRDEYEYFLLEELPDGDLIRKREYDFSHPDVVRILGTNLETVISILSDRGIEFSLQSEEEVTVGNQSTLSMKNRDDVIVRRAIAKISFNYLAYCETEGLVYDQRFDYVRRFIRFGEEPNFSFMGKHEKTILDGLDDGRMLSLHIITVEWVRDRSEIGLCPARSVRLGGPSGVC